MHLAKGQILENLYDLISGDENARVCKDIPDEACTAIPENFFIQLASSVASKLGDALSDPKLVLTWLLHTIGAPALAVASLVPVREAGALLPQLAIGGTLRSFPIRKWFWVVGSLLQGVSVLLMALAVIINPVSGTGWIVLGLLVVFSVARSVCSVSGKDLIGKTIPKTRRGRLSGLATTAAGTITLAVGFFFLLNRPEGFATREFAVLLIIACGLWLIAAGFMARLGELPGATSGGGNALKEALRSLRLIVDDVNFRNFVIARALLASTVLSMPFYVILAQDATGGRLAGLGILLVASSSATALSASVWGWMADRSSRRTLAVAGLCAALIGCVTFLVSGAGIEGDSALWVYGGLFFLIGLAHTGIRIGRKTYLVDSAPSEQRASYVALSNTLIGTVLLLSGTFGLLTPFVGVRGVVLVFALLVLALVLREAEA
jgi:hypothetical protein